MTECKKCGAAMKMGKALVQTMTGMPDFIGCNEVVTVSPGGPVRLTDCLKCPKCGYSVTIPGEGMTQQEYADERPSCFDRPDFGGVWRPGCSQWFSGGNAFVTLSNIDKGGKVFSWAACDGCERKSDSGA